MHDLIVVPLDGSKLAERAMAMAVPLAEQQGARILLLGAYGPVLPIILGGGVPVREPALDRAWRGERATYLEKAARRLGAQTTVPVESRMVDGGAAEAIQQAAADARAALIVMTSHGRGGFKRFWLGSVADRVVRTATVPVLLLSGGRTTGTRQAGRPLFAHLLVALDGSRRAESAIPHARALLPATGSKLTLAHVVDPVLALPATSEAQRPEQVVVESYLAPLAHGLRSDALAVEHAVGIGEHVAAALIELAGTTGAGAIAITSHGAGELPRFVVGSTTDKLIRTSPVPILVCPASGEPDE